MRFIIYGLGAIGGTLAAALALVGEDVIGIARGAHLAAIRADGLLFRTPDAAHRVQLKTAATPADITFAPDDAIILCMKSQDTAVALAALGAAGVTAQPILCAQNGVDNERQALRVFANVYGVTVMVPGSHTVPGEVSCYAAPRYGMLDLGRYPRGRDATAEAAAAAFTRANFRTEVFDAVMVSKYGKLLENQRNIVEAALGPGVAAPRIFAALQAEGEAAYRAAGIAWMPIGNADPRRIGVMDAKPVAGAPRAGGSSTQSLVRGAGSIETLSLNGEIVLIGRLHGVPTPVNEKLCALSGRLVAERRGPGSMTLAALEAALGF